MNCDFRSPSRAALGALCAALVLGAAGCDQIQRFTQSPQPEQERQAKPVPSDTAEATKPVTPQVLTSARLTLANSGEPPVETSACYARLITLGGGRPAVLQLTSYPSPSQEVFPAVFFQGAVRASSLSGLVGKKIPGQLYIQPVEDGPIWHSASDAPVELTVTSANPRAVIAEISGGELRHTASTARTTIQGIFSATVP